MPNVAPRPWRMFLPLGIVLLLALLWSIYWWVASGLARDRFEQERAGLASRGLVLACAEERWGGYPFHFEFSCQSPVVTQAGKFEITSADLLLVALAYAPWQIAALVDGPSRIAMAGETPLEVTHQRGLAAMTFDKDGHPSLSAELPAVSVGGLGTGGKVMLFTRPAQQGTEIALEASQVTWTPPGKPALALDDTSLRGVLQPDDTFRLDRFEATQGQLRLWGSGKMALDGQHRLSGQIDTETNDIRALLAVSSPYLGLSDSKLANLRTMLGLLGSGAKAPIIAKDGILYLGPFQVAELKPVY